MSNGRKRKDEQRAKCPTMCCAYDHCSNPSRKIFNWAPCRVFMMLIRSNKTAFDCPYYIP